MPSEIAASYAVEGGNIKISLMFVTSPHGLLLTVTDNKLLITPKTTIAPTEIELI